MGGESKLVVSNHMESDGSIDDVVNRCLHILNEQELNGSSAPDVEVVQKLLECAIKLYVQCVYKNASGNQDHMEIVSPLPQHNTLTDTDVSIFMDLLLKQRKIELFELQMWRSLGSNYD